MPATPSRSLLARRLRRLPQRPRRRRRRRPLAHSEPASSPLIPAEVARLVAAIAVAVIVFGGIVLGGIRILQNPRRRDEWAYGGRAAHGAPRMITIDRYDTRALVIPAVIIVLGLLLMVALAGVIL